MIRRSLALVALLALSASPAWAEAEPLPGRADPRIRTIVYNENNVVGVDATYGTSVMLILGEGEHIETITLGDSVAWKVEPNKRGNIVFLKPVAPHAATNMNIVSDRRTYVFALRSNAASVRGQVYTIKFRYPGEDRDAKLEEEAARLINDPNRKAFNVKHANTDYGYKGSDALKPVAVFDDGKKTWFQFQGEESQGSPDAKHPGVAIGGEVPAIFIVDQDRNESLQNFRREGKFLVVDKISRQWTLRSGNVSTCVFNLRPSAPDPTGMEAYGPQRMSASATAPFFSRSR